MTTAISTINEGTNHEDIERMQRSSHLNSVATISPSRLFLLLLILGFGLRMGYGIGRYRSDLIRLSGPAFINAWDFDALEHVLIAKALLSGKGYIVDDSPVLHGKVQRYVGQDAVYKAPLYQFFLAGVFAISGFSFMLFFPLQALLGGLLSGLVGLITLETFRRPRAAWIAGFGAAAHPVLVNSASQPYNENLFFLFFVASIWAFLLWFRTQHIRWAFLCGATIGLCALTRESGLPLLAMGAIAVVATPRNPRSWAGWGVVVLTAVAVVAPWTIRNYIRFKTVVPVASILGADLACGNNECTASESIFTPYSAEASCLPFNRRRAQAVSLALPSHLPAAVLIDRISGRLALVFIREHPAAYGKLAFRRLWTALLPYDPRGNQRLHNRLAFVAYWLAIFPAGIASAAVGLKRMEARPMLLVLLVALNILSIMAVLYWSDLRFRVGIDLLLACFAGWGYDEVLRRRAHDLGFASGKAEL
jgi:4-amino-4-deoxy-L-arabinose transferase-like glycosyltransferase